MKNNFLYRILYVVFVTILVFVIIVVISDKNVKTGINVINDTIYNKIVLDSIQLNIIKKESIIYNIKEQHEYEKEEIINSNDSNVVNKFYELISD